MSSLQKVLPACEPARSEALALLAKTHHVSRHLVKGIAKRGLAVGGAVQRQQQALQEASAHVVQDAEAPTQRS